MAMFDVAPPHLLTQCQTLFVSLFDIATLLAASRFGMATFVGTSPDPVLLRPQTLLAAGICTKSGRALVSRQFVEMSRPRIEGLYAAFPKLAVCVGWAP